MKFTFAVQAELERNSGKSATRQEVAAQIIEVLEGAYPEFIEGEGGGWYEVTQWEVAEASQTKGRKP